VNSASAAARRISAAFAGILFLTSTTTGRPGPVVSGEAERGVPETTRTGACATRWPAIAAMMAAVVL
jgi:hypothetical protein